MQFGRGLGRQDSNASPTRGISKASKTIRKTKEALDTRAKKNGKAVEFEDDQSLDSSSEGSDVESVSSEESVMGLDVEVMKPSLGLPLDFFMEKKLKKRIISGQFVDYRHLRDLKKVKTPRKIKLKDKYQSSVQRLAELSFRQWLPSAISVDQWAEVSWELWHEALAAGHKAARDLKSPRMNRD